MALQNTLGTSSITICIVVEIFVIVYYGAITTLCKVAFSKHRTPTGARLASVYYLIYTAMQSFRSSSSPKAVQGHLELSPQANNPSSPALQTTAPPFSGFPQTHNLCLHTLIYLVRVLDVCTPAVLMLTRATLFLSAADSTYAAFGLYVLTLMLPFTVLERLHDLHRCLAEADSEDDPSSTGTAEDEESTRAEEIVAETPGHAKTTTRLARQDIKKGALYMLAIAMFAVVLFLNAIPRLQVPRDVAKVIETTAEKVPLSCTFTLPNWKCLTQFALLLLVPRRLSRNAAWGLFAGALIAAYLALDIFWVPHLTGRHGSLRHHCSTVLLYEATRWQGAVLSRISVVLSGVVWFFNPIWDINLHGLRETLVKRSFPQQHGQST